MLKRRPVMPLSVKQIKVSPNDLIVRDTGDHHADLALSAMVHEHFNAMESE